MNITTWNLCLHVNFYSTTIDTGELGIVIQLLKFYTLLKSYDIQYICTTKSNTCSRLYEILPCNMVKFKSSFVNEIARCNTMKFQNVEISSSM